MFYVYEWFVVDSGEIFYVGKGCKKRYLQKTRRNKYFNIYLRNFNCSSRIIKYFVDEQSAFEYEHERILELKKIGQAICNLDYGGNGGVNFIWTEEMRKYKSIYNPMKLYEQRERMVKNNPMKNEEVKNRVAEKIRKAVVINNVYYEGAKIASQKIGVCKYTIYTWCKRGYNTKGEPCRYANEQQKEYPKIKQTHPQATTPKAVIVDGKRFETVKDGAKSIGVWSETLIRAIKGNRKCKGHTCWYDNQQPSRGKFDNSTMKGSTTNG